MEKSEIISIITAFLSSGVLNAVISNILYDRKLKKDLKNNGDNMLAEKIEEGLLKIRELELKTTEQEILNIDKELNSRGAHVNMFQGEVIYPAIYNDMGSIKKYLDEIRLCRKKYEMNVSIKVALNLVFIDRYIMQSILFIKDNLDKLNMHEWSALLIFDIQKWQKRFNKLIVKEINKHNYKLESHATKKWNRLRKKELESQYSSTILNFLLTGKCHKKDKKNMKFIEDSLNIYESK